MNVYRLIDISGANKVWKYSKNIYIFWLIW